MVKLVFLGIMIWISTPFYSLAKAAISPTQELTAAGWLFFAMWPGLLGLTILGYNLLFGTMALRRYGRGEFRLQPQGPRTLKWDNEGIEISGGGERVMISWSNISEVRESHQTLVFVLGGGKGWAMRYEVAPLAAFTREHRLDLLETHTRARSGHKE